MEKADGLSAQYTGFFMSGPFIIQHKSRTHFLCLLSPCDQGKTVNENISPITTAASTIIDKVCLDILNLAIKVTLLSAT